MNNGQATSVGRGNERRRAVGRSLHRWVRLHGGNWAKANTRSIKAVTWNAYQYCFGWGKEIRPLQKRTKANWIWWAHRWTTVERWTAPRFDACVCNGHGERYGYPRHHAYLLIYWNRRGYAIGVEFSVPNSDYAKSGR